MYKYKLYIIFLVSALTIIGAVGFYNQEKDIEEIYKKDLDAEIIDFKHLKTLSLRIEEVSPQEVIFSTKGSWIQFWNKYGEGEVPHVNFSQSIIAGIFLGEKPSPGYGVEIVGIQKIENQTEIQFVEYLPNPDLGYAAVLVYPYDLVVFPKTEGRFTFHSFKEIKK